ncbi:Protein RTA1 [Ceratocystis fimbriata CBS 114723]|uniref:Protein RTA1 n=1 Tax=Ceratocystis fimbriata CBS 114723 TaxID=1035309 RepID=A0A2C5XFL9_9PEZI|nr:Protein RTA1 [Ceratocystis fimbriata CBS 114723]
MAGGDKNDLYKYDPSFAAAVVFTIGFLLSSLVHAFQIVKTKSWFFIPFLMGSIFEVIGYACRGIGAKETPDWSMGPFIMQSLLLLLGPTFYAASIYMILGRLITLLEAQEYSLVRPSWLTKFFLVGDIASILLQGMGGGKLANADTASQRSSGENLIVGGLVVQILFFTLFMVVTCLFHMRIKKKPTSAIKRLDNTWYRLLLVLYAASFLILVRSLFRMIEYIQGSESVLQTEEIFIYVLDATLMLIASVLLNIFHPSKCFSDKNSGGSGRESATQLKDYNTEYQRVEA